MSNDQSNSVTLNSYESNINSYIIATPDTVSGICKAWIDTTIKLLPQRSSIIEIGSAFGRDAEYIESKGFKVERTDAAEGFVKLLKQKGYSSSLFNILIDEFKAKYDLVFANGVFLHFNREEFKQTLIKIHKGLNSNGIVSFSVKVGEGEEWSSDKLGSPRYYCYWQQENLSDLLRLTGFQVIEMYQANKFLYIIARQRAGQ